MYKIFANDLPLIIVTPDEYQAIQTADLVRIENDKKTLKEVLEWMIAAPSKGYITISNEPEKTLDLLKSVCKPIDAAGGVVFNTKKQLLMIKRLGLWDLPKGKVDPGESFDFTAIREVKEECGITHCTIKKPVGETYHIYHQYPHLMIKTCHWFWMDSTDENTPKPQQEEHIEQAKWVDTSDINTTTLHTYETIRNLLKELKIGVDKI